MSSHTAKIAELNDLLRATFLSGKVVLTAGIRRLGDADRAAIIIKVREFTAFTPDNDPHGKHDLGVIEQDGVGTGRSAEAAASPRPVPPCMFS